MTFIDFDESLAQESIARGATEVHPANSHITLLLDLRADVQGMVTAGVATVLQHLAPVKTVSPDDAPFYA